MGRNNILKHVRYGFKLDFPCLGKLINFLLIWEGLSPCLVGKKHVR